MQPFVQRCLQALYPMVVHFFCIRNVPCLKLLEILVFNYLIEKDLIFEMVIVSQLYLELLVKM